MSFGWTALAETDRMEVGELVICMGTAMLSCMTEFCSMPCTPSMPGIPSGGWGVETIVSEVFVIGAVATAEVAGDWTNGLVIVAVLADLPVEATLMIGRPLGVGSAAASSL